MSPAVPRRYLKQGAGQTHPQGQTPRPVARTAWGDRSSRFGRGMSVIRHNSDIGEASERNHHLVRHVGWQFLQHLLGRI